MNSDLNNLINENTTIVSDPHFGYAAINKFVPKREEFIKNNKNFRNMEDYMLKKWNEASAKHNVLCLGDFAFKGVQTYGNLLNGKNILLPGNHDKKSKEIYLKSGFQNIIQGVFIQENNYIFKLEDVKPMLNCFIKEINGCKIMFSHFPVFDDNPYDKKFDPITKELENLFLHFKCDLNIHGHTHTTDSKEDFCFNASIDAIDYKFLTIKEILEERGFKGEG